MIRFGDRNPFYHYTARIYIPYITDFTRIPREPVFNLLLNPGQYRIFGKTYNQKYCQQDDSIEKKDESERKFFQHQWTLKFFAGLCVQLQQTILASGRIIRK